MLDTNWSAVSNYWSKLFSQPSQLSPLDHVCVSSNVQLELGPSSVSTVVLLHSCKHSTQAAQDTYWKNQAVALKDWEKKDKELKNKEVYLKGQKMKLDADERALKEEKLDREHLSKKDVAVSAV